MGRVTKKTNTKVASAPAKAPPSKRDAQVKLEKPNAKKQKKDLVLEQAEEKKVEEKTQNNMDICSAQESPGSEEEVKEPADKIVPDQKESQLANKEQQSNSSEEGSGSEDGSEDEDKDEEIPDADGEAKVAPSISAKNEVANDEKIESISEEGSPQEDETVEKTAAPQAPVTSEQAKNGPEESNSEEESSEEDVEASSDEDVAAKAGKSTTSAAENEMGTDDDSEDDDSGSEDDGSGSEDEEPKSTYIKPQTPATPKAGAQGSKTVFIGNLAWSIGEDDIKTFFKGIGVVKEVRLSKLPNGKLKGFGHVDFTTSEAAVKALELAGKDLGGRSLRIDLAVEKTASTPDSGKQNNAQKQVKQGTSGGTTIYVRGFDKNDSEEEVRSALEKHFGSCGEIKDTRLPTQHGSLKGMAYIEFARSDAVNKALKLNDSKLGSNTLQVEEAKPRGDSGGGRGGGRGGRGGGRGRRGGRGSR
ncbi:unnamed protein product [Cuscuta campestris]|uniref:RRM domain-containing protein n=1 Tax=Cuscuta campestris TaxID=132261 RepID=A0A484N9F3_9ASTE|nr:unnamed protein product [Cuscuta campestris]